MHEFRFVPFLVTGRSSRTRSTEVLVLTLFDRTEKRPKFCVRGHGIPERLKRVCLVSEQKLLLRSLCGCCKGKTVDRFLCKRMFRALYALKMLEKGVRIIRVLVCRPLIRRRENPVRLEVGEVEVIDWIGQNLLRGAPLVGRHIFQIELIVFHSALPKRAARPLVDLNTLVELRLQRLSRNASCKMCGNGTVYRRAGELVGGALAHLVEGSLRGRMLFAEVGSKCVGLKVGVLVAGITVRIFRHPSPRCLVVCWTLVSVSKGPVTPISVAHRLSRCIQSDRTKIISNASICIPTLSFKMQRSRVRR